MRPFVQNLKIITSKLSVGGCTFKIWPTNSREKNLSESCQCDPIDGGMNGMQLNWPLARECRWKFASQSFQQPNLYIFLPKPKRDQQNTSCYSHILGHRRCFRGEYKRVLVFHSLIKRNFNIFMSVLRHKINDHAQCLQNQN